MLELKNLCVHYGKTQVLWDVSLTVEDRSMVALMGPNGSGKSTVFKAITGLTKVSSGEVWWCGEQITNAPAHKMVKKGISLVLERRRLFSNMSVMENVLLGAFSERSRAAVNDALASVVELLPIVSERATAVAGSLSGGQQQMIAIARGLMANPKLLIMDEPFLGLTPLMVQQTMAIMKRVNASGVSVLFNEQNAKVSFANSDKGILLQSGHIRLTGSGLQMLSHPEVAQVYLGH
jgi:branched-chain amino acid transport system ATP-binding protein